MILVDSHCHLDMLAAKGADIGEIVSSAEQKNVKYLQSICTRISDLPAILEIARRHQNIFATVGVHPCNVDGSESAQELLNLAGSHPKITALGETGLDYYRDHEDKRHVAYQKASFIAHIEASQQTGLPVIVHARSADDDIADIMMQKMKEKKFTGLIHCFTASKDLAKKMLDIGIYISFSGIVTFKNARDLQEIARCVPLDMMLIETDSPYLAPEPMRGKTNEPSYVYYVAQYLSQLLGHSAEKIAEKTTNNYFSLFSKASR